MEHNRDDEPLLEAAKIGCCGGLGVPVFLLLKATAMLAFNAFFVSQIEAISRDGGFSTVTGVPDWIVNALAVVYRIFCDSCWTDGDGDDGIYFLSVTHKVWVVVVVLNTLEVVLSLILLLFAACGTRCSKTVQSCNYGLWITLALLQIPSFLIVTVFTLMAAIGLLVFALFNNVGGIIVTYITAALCMTVGMLSLCFACSRARSSSPTHRQRRFERVQDREDEREHRRQHKAQRRLEKEARKHGHAQPPHSAPAAMPVPGVYYQAGAPQYQQAPLAVPVVQYDQNLPQYPPPAYTSVNPTAPSVVHFRCEYCGAETTSAGFCGSCGQKLM